MTNPFSTDNLINEHFFPLTKGGEGSGRYPKGSEMVTTPRVGMSMSEYHFPGGGSAYHFIVISTSNTGHKFVAHMAYDKEKAKAFGEKLANASSQVERDRLVSEAISNRVISSKGDTYTRRRSGEYQRVGRSGRWLPQVTLGSDYTQELWD